MLVVDLAEYTLREKTLYFPFAGLVQAKREEIVLRLKTKAFQKLGCFALGIEIERNVDARLALQKILQERSVLE